MHSRCSTASAIPCITEDGLPVTALESRDIEIIYGDAVAELARFETLIREARGQQ
jgi:hypothetical protein